MRTFALSIAGEMPKSLLRRAFPVATNVGSTSLFFELADAGATWFNDDMRTGYGQFCPIAKACEVLAMRWTPLILRQLMYDSHSFNDIYRGVPLISRAVLVTRLRDLERHGVIERRRRTGAAGHEYWLTPAGDALRPILGSLGEWGLTHARDWLEPADLDPTFFMWALRKGIDIDVLPAQRVVVRFEFSGVPASRTKYQILWLLLERLDVDVCVKDPGFPVDLVFRGHIRDFIALYLGHVQWRQIPETSLTIEADNKQFARALPRWLRLDKVLGRDLPVVPEAA
jgi:DNA-binding HxlR family transcriptional regulator